MYCTQFRNLQTLLYINAGNVLSRSFSFWFLFEVRISKGLSVMQQIWKSTEQMFPQLPAFYTTPVSLWGKTNVRSSSSPIVSPHWQYSHSSTYIHKQACWLCMWVSVARGVLTLFPPNVEKKYPLNSLCSN